ncbi:MAG: adenylate/guanylate cyclase domain-containing protein [bacterium]|nr:adenylate/guanylate cyclase domain-containing protein [bacterium]
MNQIDLTAYQNLLQSEVNVTLRRGSFWAAVLGYLCAAGLSVMIFGGFAERMETPFIWALICGTYSGIVYFVARANLVRGVGTYVVILSFTSLPGVLYLLSYFLLPSGTATYINGPPSYLFFCVVIFSGFAFDARLSTISGALASLEYTIAFWLGRDALAEVSSPDPLLTQDLSQMPIYFFKAVILFFSGIFVGTIATTARRLLTRILSEEREKSSIAGLFGQYVSGEVKDRIIAERAGALGETRSVALLFCDIRGFTSFSESQSPENIVRQLNEYFDAMGDRIAQANGTIDKFIGDAVMAYFGGLIQLDRPCDNAFQAAVGMRTALKDLNRRRMDRGLPALENGIGMHYGPVLQGSIGSKDRKNYSVIGDSVNTAARIESLCGRLEEPLLISGDFFNELSAEHQSLCVSLGPADLKGKSQAIELYAVRESAGS